MKNIFIILIIVLIGNSSFSQSIVLDSNQVRAIINANGCLFTNPSNYNAGYEVPKMNGAGPDVIYSSAFWIGVKDQNDSIRVCANSFYNGMKDFQIGPVASNYTDSAFIDKFDYVYVVTKDQIQFHKNNWNDVNYIIPNDILNWPGNGEITNGEASNLAPFVDNNANNLYEPELGEYPAIRGDKASFFILNDNNGNHAFSGGQNLNMEYQFMIYQYHSAGYLDSSTFINLRIINRSTEVYDDLIVGNYSDFDIGNPFDDYFGCASNKNMVFAYNADNDDNQSSAPINTFGINPPACGIKVLNHNMNTAVGYYQTTTGPGIDPQVDVSMWRAMHGEWPDGTHYTKGGTGVGGSVLTNFLFDGNPNNPALWTEHSESNPSADRRYFMATESIDNFAPGDYICYDYAILFSRSGGNNLLNVNGLFDVADSAQLFYDSQQHFYCQSVVLGTDEIISQNDEIKLFPNPAQSEFSIIANGVFSIEIYDLSGKLIAKQNNINVTDRIQAPLVNGIYMVRVLQNEQATTVLKLIKE